jgi:hypothetical protein
LESIEASYDVRAATRRSGDNLTTHQVQSGDHFQKLLNKASQAALLSTSAIVRTNTEKDMGDCYLFRHPFRAGTMELWV